MNRLTKRDYKCWEQTNGYYNKKNAQRLTKITHKLGALEDLEEELGCPLEVLIKGFIDSNKLNDNCDFKQKIMTYNCSGKLIEGYEMQLSYGENIDIAVDGEDNNNDYDVETITVKIKDYGKTWWLKEKNNNKEVE